MVLKKMSCCYCFMFDEYAKLSYISKLRIILINLIAKSFA